MAEPVPKLCASNKQTSHRFDYQFTVDNFSSRSQVFLSGLFSPPGLEEPKFYLQCQRNNGGYFYVYIYLQENLRSKDYYYVACNMHLIYQNEQKYNIYNTASTACNSNVLICQIAMTSISTTYLPGNTAKILCEFTILIDEKTNRDIALKNEDRNEEKEKEKLDQEHLIVDDLTKLLQDGIFSDFVIQLGDKKLPVHKSILSIRSPYFAAMFKGDFEENKEKKLAITDVDPDLFEELLCYIYTSKIPSVDKNAAEFLALADKYQLDSLKSICENALYDQLDSNTMVNTYLLADTYNADDLKTKTIEFISTRTSPQDVIKAMLSNKNIRVFEALDDFEKNKN